MTGHEAPAAAGGGRILVVVPAYREEKNIGAVVSSVRAQYPYDVLVVNDGSPDGTSWAARAAGAVVLDLPFNLGIGGAVQSAFLYARDHGYDVVVRIDGDGQHEVEDIGKVLGPVLDGRADACIGSRFLGETEYRGSIPRIFGIHHFRWLVNLFTGYRVTDPTSGFFAINRRLIEFYSQHYPSDYPEVDAYILMHRLGARTVEVPVRMYARAEGKSSITTFKALQRDWDGYVAASASSAMTSKFWSTIGINFVLLSSNIATTGGESAEGICLAGTSRSRWSHRAWPLGPH